MARLLLNEWPWIDDIKGNDVTETPADVSRRAFITGVIVLTSSC